MGDVKVPNFNNVQIAGRLGMDPDLRYTTNGKAYCKFSVAHNRYWRDAAGNQVQEGHFFDVTCWDKLAEWVGEKIKKGRPVLVEGELRQEIWEDRETGQKRSKVSINAMRVHVLDFDADAPADGQRGQTAASSRPAATARPAAAPAPAPRPAPRQAELVPEDDIPF